jgi:hypothetical protein
MLILYLAMVDSFFVCVVLGFELRASSLYYLSLIPALLA